MLWWQLQMLRWTPSRSCILSAAADAPHVMAVLPRPAVGAPAGGTSRSPFSFCILDRGRALAWCWGALIQHTDYAIRNAHFQQVAGWVVLPPNLLHHCKQQHASVNICMPAGLPKQLSACCMQGPCVIWSAATSTMTQHVLCFCPKPKGSHEMASASGSPRKAAARPAAMVE